MKVTEEGFKLSVKSHLSKSSVIHDLGYSPTGANYRSFNILVRKWNVDCSHFTGQAHNKGKRFPPRRPLDDFLVPNSDYYIGHLKQRIINEGVLLNKCAKCGIEPIWCNEPLMLVLDHIDGDSRNHSRNNLRLLCPNCNSQTPTFAGRNLSSKLCPQCGRRMSAIYHKEAALCKTCERRNSQPQRRASPRKHVQKYQTCPSCGNQMVASAKRCSLCWRRGQPQKFHIDKEELSKLVWEMPTEQIGKKYGVSGKAIEKRCKRLGIPKPPRGYWAKLRAGVV
jgi:predicted amidophosphoribosyltransferase